MPNQLMPWLYSTIGCCFLFFPTVVVLEIARWVPGFPTGSESLIAIVCVVVLAIYAMLNAQRLHVKTVRLDALKGSADQTIVQLSDVHIGSRSPAYLTRIVKRVRKLNPDWVVITGDLLDAPTVAQEQLEPLREIAHQTLFVTGNHERYEGIDRVTSILTDLGVTVLRKRRTEHLAVSVYRH